jgi:antitoxin FitA
MRALHRSSKLICLDMPKTVQIRDVPDEVHRILKSRAAREGMSLSDFIKRELERTTGRPSMLEWLESTKEGKPIRSSKSAAQILRELRDGR